MLRVVEFGWLMALSLTVLAQAMHQQKLPASKIFPGEGALVPKDLPRMGPEEGMDISDVQISHQSSPGQPRTLVRFLREQAIYSPGDAEGCLLLFVGEPCEACSEIIENVARVASLLPAGFFLAIVATGDAWAKVASLESDQHVQGRVVVLDDRRDAIRRKCMVRGVPVGVVVSSAGVVLGSRIASSVPLVEDLIRRSARASKTAAAEV